MRICDITRNDEVVGTVSIRVITEGEDAEVHEIEVGKAALDSFRAGDWSALHRLTPAALRVKDVKRSKAAVKAAGTRKANKAAGTPSAATADASSALVPPLGGHGGTNVPATPLEAPAATQRSNIKGENDPF